MLNSGRFNGRMYLYSDKTMTQNGHVYRLAVCEAAMENGKVSGCDRNVNVWHLIEKIEWVA